jgi:hypothetical protein
MPGPFHCFGAADGADVGAGAGALLGGDLGALLGGDLGHLLDLLEPAFGTLALAFELVIRGPELVEPPVSLSRPAALPPELPENLLSFISCNLAIFSCRSSRAFSALNSFSQRSSSASCSW